MALTGSDPYFRTGTDVAVLFEAPQSGAAGNLLLAQINLAAAQGAAGQAGAGRGRGLAYRGVRSPDRSVCGYVARLDGAVVVTNSLVPVGPAGQRGPKASRQSIASLPEYVFFRNRYRAATRRRRRWCSSATPTIRRWCGPRWRIANSRRTRDVAVMAELQASQHGPAGRRRTSSPARSTPIWPLPTSASWRWTPEGVAPRCKARWSS